MYLAARGKVLGGLASLFVRPARGSTPRKCCPVTTIFLMLLNLILRLIRTYTPAGVTVVAKFN